jgi:hypothetical protein
VPIATPSLCGANFWNQKRSDGASLYCYTEFTSLSTLTFVEVYLNNERKPAGYQDPLTPPTLKEDPALLEILPGSW